MEDLKLNPTDKAILDRLAEGRATPSYIAQAEDYSRQNVTNRLRRLEEHGIVDKIHTGLYELVEDPREATVESEDAVRREEPAEQSDGPHVTFPSGVDRGYATAAVFAARDLIRERDGATKKEIVREVMPEHPLGYDADAALAKLDAGERYRGSWWRNVMKPGLEALDGVEKPPEGRSEWRYTGGDDE